MAARSANGNVSHAGLADSAESIAVLTSFGLALAYLATISECEAGLGWLAREEASDCRGSCQLLNVHLKTARRCDTSQADHTGSSVLRMV